MPDLKRVQLDCTPCPPEETGWCGSRAPIRQESVPDSGIVLVRAGHNGVEPAKVRADARRSLATLGILGISVQASRDHESLAQTWEASRVLRVRDVIWWATAGQLRAANFPLLATGADDRHYTIVLAHTEQPLLEALLEEFTRVQR